MFLCVVDSESVSSVNILSYLEKLQEHVLLCKTHIMRCITKYKTQDLYKMTFKIPKTLEMILNFIHSKSFLR